jgi:hypothetical protein
MVFPSYCCGHETCNKLVPATPGRRDIEGAPPAAIAQDITAVKRAPILERTGVVKKQEACHFTKLDDKVKTTYGTPKVSSNFLECPFDSEFGCPLEAHYDVGQTIGTSQSLSTSVGFTGGFLGLGLSVGIDTTTSEEWSSSTTFGQSYSIFIGASHRAYLAFQPRYKCKY